MVRNMLESLILKNVCSISPFLGYAPGHTQRRPVNMHMGEPRARHPHRGRAEAPLDPQAAGGARGGRRGGGGVVFSVVTGTGVNVLYMDCGKSKS